MREREREREREIERERSPLLSVEFYPYQLAWNE